MVNNDFYVYEWYNVDTDEVFYVGKGRKNRYKDIIQRNQYFKNYYNKYECDVRKAKTDLTEEEAFDLEKELIADYKSKSQCQCNLTEGGEGCTFPENTWHYWFRKLQYLHDCKGAMDDMCNEEDYDSKNLKTKSMDELKNLYNQYVEYKHGIRTAKDL